MADKEYQVRVEAVEPLELKRRKFYRPFSTSPWLLCIYLTVILTFIVGSSVLLRQASSTQSVSRRDVSVNDSGLTLGKRQTNTTNTVNTTNTANTTNTSGSETATETDTETYTTTVGRPPIDEQLVITSVTTPITRPTSGDQLTSISTQSSQPPLSKQVSSTAASTANSAPRSQPTATSSTITRSPANSMASDTDAASVPVTTYEGPPPTAPPPAGQLTTGKDFTKWHYFLAIYFPRVLTVALKSAWATTFAAMRKMEPFCILASASGGSAKTTVLAKHLSGGLSYRNGLIITLASFTSLLISLIVSLIPESLKVVSRGVCQLGPNTTAPCQPELVIMSQTVYALQVLFSILFITIVSIAYLLHRRPSGVSSDPSSIASLASLLNDQHIIQDLQAVHPNASDKDVNTALKGNKYSMGLVTDNTGQQRYGIVKTSSNAVEDIPLNNGYTPLPNPNSPAQVSTFRKFIEAKWIGDAVLLASVTCLFGIILAYYKIEGNSQIPFNKFMNQKGFGPRFLLSIIALLINQGFEKIERELRMMEPFRLMAHSPQPAKGSVLATTASSRFTSGINGLRLGHWFVALFAFVSFLSEVLIVTLPGIPFESYQTATSYEVATWISLTVLSIMALAVVAIMIRRRRDPDTPRLPDSIANIWLYLCAGNMLGSRNSGALDLSEKQRRAEFANRLFCFGPVMAADGQTRWTVNET